MAKQGFDWTKDTRQNAHTVAPLTEWDDMAAKVPSIIEASQSSCTPLFVHNASTIYARMEDHGKEAKKSAVLLARHERLALLLHLWETSNPIDFYFIKFPAWWFSDRMERKKERKLC